MRSALRAGALGLICQPTRHPLPRYKQHDKVMLSKECPSAHNCTFLRMLMPTELNNPPAHFVMRATTPPPPRNFLGELWAAGKDVVRRDTVALRPDLRQRKR